MVDMSAPTKGYRPEITVENVLRRFVSGERLRSIALEMGVSAARLGHSIEVLVKFVDPELAARVDLRKRKFDRKPEDRFWDFVFPEPNSGCWLWTGDENGNGYGIFRFSGRTEYAHRHTFRTMVRPLKQGETVDHLCVTPFCCNPDHLEGVSVSENAKRAITRRRALRTHCPNGHALIAENVRIKTGKKQGSGTVECRECGRIRMKSWREKNRRVSAAKGV